MINVADTLKPKNNGSFPVAEAKDVAFEDGTRLQDKMNNIYTKSEVDAKISQTSMEDVYTKSEVDTKISQSKMDLEFELDEETGHLYMNTYVDNVDAKIDENGHLIITFDN